MDLSGVWPRSRPWETRGQSVCREVGGWRVSPFSRAIEGVRNECFYLMRCVRVFLVVGRAKWRARRLGRGEG